MLVNRKKPKFARIALTATVNGVVDFAMNTGIPSITVKMDAVNGTLLIKDGDDVAYKGLRKGGPGQPWIVSGWDTTNIKWGEEKA